MTDPAPVPLLKYTAASDLPCAVCRMTIQRGEQCYKFGNWKGTEPHQWQHLSHVPADPAPVPRRVVPMTRARLSSRMRYAPELSADERALLAAMDDEHKLTVAHALRVAIIDVRNQDHAILKDLLEAWDTDRFEAMADLFEVARAAILSYERFKQPSVVPAADPGTSTLADAGSPPPSRHGGPIRGKDFSSSSSSDTDAVERGTSPPSDSPPQDPT